MPATQRFRKEACLQPGVAEVDQVGGGMVEVEGEGGPRRLVEGGFPEGVEDDAVQGVFEPGGAHAQRVVKGEYADLLAGDAGEGAAAGGGTEHSVVAHHVYLAKWCRLILNVSSLTHTRRFYFADILRQ